MSLAVFEHVSLHFGKKTIVDDLDLRIGPEDRIGIVGPNGSGKTSLMRMLAGEQAPDGGRVRKRNGMRLGYLPQDIAITVEKNLIDFVRASVEGRQSLDAEIARCEKELADIQAGKHRRSDDQDISDEELLMEVAERLADLHERATHFDMHYTEHEATRILAGLGFVTADLKRPIAELSGGWKMRAVLASLLFQKPDLLLLDEPTNHLDMPSVAWLSDFLQAYGRAFMLICHDREFLNEQIRRVVSFEPEGVRQYSGNYDKYVAQRAEEEIILENKAKNLAREREQAERFINRFRAQANKAKAVQSRIKQLEKMESVELYQKRKVMRFKFPPCARSGAESVTLKGLGKRYGDHPVLSDVNLTVRRGDKIGIIGVNGAGKTTLLRMIAGEIEPSAGSVELGHNVKAGYYAQHHAETLHPDDTIYDTVYREDEDSSVTRVRTILGAFLFSDDDVDKKIGVLSGGERARVALARLLINPGNLLMMDEPTNHLDLASSEALAESLESYDGTLIFVSHNRSFVRRLATRIWNVADGHVETYPGTLDEYMDSWRARIEAEQQGGRGTGDVGGAPAETKVSQQAESKRKRGSRAEEKERKRREAEARNAKNGLRKLEKQVQKLEAEIAELEASQKGLGEQLADPEVYADTARSGELIAAFQEGKDRLVALQARWEEAMLEIEQLGA
ncbi:MAG: ABC-F family ATP-binding cassette domain-containing protein [Myxococcales bacterium]